MLIGVEVNSFLVYILRGFESDEFESIGPGKWTGHEPQPLPSSDGSAEGCGMQYMVEISKLCFRRFIVFSVHSLGVNFGALHQNWPDFSLL